MENQQMKNQYIFIVKSITNKGTKYLKGVAEGLNREDTTKNIEEKLKLRNIEFEYIDIEPLKELLSWNEGVKFINDPID